MTRASTSSRRGRAARLGAAAALWAIAAGGSPAADEEFSRSRELSAAHRRIGVPWIEPRAMRPVAGTPAPAPFEARIPAPLRLSPDLLPGAAGSQPETQAEAHAALDRSGAGRRLLVGYQESRFENGGARGLGVALSENLGKTWSAALLPGLTAATGGPWDRASDPWVAFGPDGRAYYASLAFHERRPENGVLVSTSGDGGRTWDPPVTVHLESTDFDDKESMIVDTGSASPYRGRVHVFWDTVRLDGFAILRSSFSDDLGRSFTPATEMARGGAHIGVVAAVGKDGTVHAAWLHLAAAGATPLLLAARSEDGGLTWSQPVTIAAALAAGVPGLRTGEGIPDLAIDPVRGTLYVVWQDARFTPGVDQIVLSLSNDGGRTWSAPRRVSDGPADAPAFTASVAVAASGAVGVSYSTMRHDPARAAFVDQYLGVSRNRGRRFLAGRRLSPVSWDVRAAAVARGFFLGDYQALAAGRWFHPVWVATLLPSTSGAGSRQPDVFTTTVK